MISMNKEIMKCETETQINENTTHLSNEQNLETILSTVESIKREPNTELTSNMDETQDSSRALESDPNISSSNLEPIDSSSEALDQMRNSETLKSPFKRPVNESIDENDNNCEDISSPKRLKTEEMQMTSNNVLNYMERELKKLLETYLDHVLELFFLQEFGNIMEFQSWRRKQPNPQLLQYLRNNCVDTDQEFKELIDLKTSIDFSSAKPSETIPLVQVLQSNSSTSRVTTPSVPSQLKVNSSSTVSIPSLSTQSTSVSTSAISTVPKVNSTTTTSLAITTTTISNARNHNNQLVPGARLTTRQHTISSFYVPAIGSQEQIVERAKQEAYVMQRIAELRKNGLWSSRRLPKVQEPPRIKVHWDYLLEEMQWLAADFAQERKWKKAAAKKCARMVMKYHSDKKCHAERAEKEEYLRLRKIASNISKQIKQFWSDIEKVFEAKQEVRLKEKRKKLHDMHLNLIVDKADKYTERLTQEFGKSLNSTEDSGLELTNSQTEEAIDSDFEPENNESDDEETIAKEEEEVGVGDGKQEIELLQKESEIPLEDLKASLPKEIFEVPATLSPNSSEPKDVVEDQDFKVDEESINAEDDEETIQEEEEKEGKVDYTSEINELETDANLPIEELIKKYASLENYALDSDDDQMEAEEDYEEEDNSSEDYDNENEDEEDFGEDMSTEEEEETGEIGMEFLINPEANEAINKPLIEVSFRHNC
jgi:E1A-binding protein p400